MRLAWICVVAGCGGGDPLESNKDIAAWANVSSAVGAFEVGREPIAFADGEFEFDDPACPTTSDDGTTATVDGNCTDNRGHVWTGSATVVRTGAVRTVSLDEFGNDALLGAVATTGSVIISEQAVDQHSFTADYVSVSGVRTTVDYSGMVSGTYDTVTTWNGTGTISRDGDFIDSGTINALTVDQVRDDTACGGESASGTTTMTSEEHVVVITYDGATDCDPDSSALFSRDGGDQQVITGVTCSTGGGGAGWIAIVLVGLLVRRRATSS
jgi:hypothetical protein